MYYKDNKKPHTNKHNHVKRGEKSSLLSKKQRAFLNWVLILFMYQRNDITR